MKFISFIFAIYILSISAMPCNDVHEGAQNEISSVTQAQDHHEDHNDICSPFCICSCCQVFVALTSFHQTLVPISLLLGNFSFYTEKFFSSSLASIWQPPKLS